MTPMTPATKEALEDPTFFAVEDGTVIWSLGRTEDEAIAVFERTTGNRFIDTDDETRCVRVSKALAAVVLAQGGGGLEYTEVNGTIYLGDLSDRVLSDLRDDAAAHDQLEMASIYEAALGEDRLALERVEQIIAAEQPSLRETPPELPMLEKARREWQSWLLAHLPHDCRDRRHRDVLDELCALSEALSAAVQMATAKSAEISKLRAVIDYAKKSMSGGLSKGATDSACDLCISLVRENEKLQKTAQKFLEKKEERDQEVEFLRRLVAQCLNQAKRIKGAHSAWKEGASQAESALDECESAAMCIRDACKVLS